MQYQTVFVWLANGDLLEWTHLLECNCPRFPSPGLDVIFQNGKPRKRRHKFPNDRLFRELDILLN